MTPHRSPPDMRVQRDGLRKLVVPLGDDAWHRFKEESLWALPKGERIFELHNTPFFAKGLAYLDLVAVEEVEGRVLVKHVIQHSMRSTYRVLVNPGVSESTFNARFIHLSDLGCSYESYVTPDWTLYAWDVPHGVVDSAYRIFDAGERDGVWSFEEGHFGG